MKPSLCTRVGAGGELKRFADLPTALIYLNFLRIGKVDAWAADGIETPNYWGDDLVRLYWGDARGNLVSPIASSDRPLVELALEENFL